MVKCGICGGEAPRQPCITEEGTCDFCGKEVILVDECGRRKQRASKVILQNIHCKISYLRKIAK
jgi:hypothetical protein